jgi:hypothetical protein
VRNQVVHIVGEPTPRSLEALKRRSYQQRLSEYWRGTPDLAHVLTNHAVALVSMDFFTVPTVTGRLLFVLVLLAHHRRRIVHVAITDHPTAAWTAQQVIEAFPDDTAPRWLLTDRDTIYSDAFRRRVAGMGISEVVCAPSSLWQNPYAERLIGSPRVPRPSHRPRRSAPAARAGLVRSLLSAGTHAPRAREGRAYSTTRAGAN